MKENNQTQGEVHHRNGDKYGSEMRSHKLAMERDFPIAVSEFRIGVLRQKKVIQECLDNLEKYSQELAEIQSRLSINEETAEEQKRGNYAEKNKEQLQMIHATTYKGTDDDMCEDYENFISNSTLEELKKYVEVN